MVRIKPLALILLSFMFLSASAALAAVSPAKMPVRGAVKSIADDKSSFVLTVNVRGGGSEGGGGSEDSTVKVNADTKYSFDGAESTFADAVKVGVIVHVTLNADGTVASEVAAHSKPLQTNPPR